MHRRTFYILTAVVLGCAFASIGSGRGSGVQLIWWTESGGTASAVLPGPSGQQTTIMVTVGQPDAGSVWSGSLRLDGGYWVGDGGGGPAPCLGDLDNDGFVNAVDLSMLIVAWGRQSSPHAADLNGDGDVGAVDLSLLLADWGVCPSPQS
jgi:hypothetical protein